MGCRPRRPRPLFQAAGRTQCPLGVQMKMHTTNDFDPLNKRQPQAAEDTELTDETTAMAGNREPEPLSSDEFRSVPTLLAEAIRANMAQGGDRPGCEAIERDPDGFIRELTASRERAIAASRRLRANAAAREAAPSTQGWLQALNAAAWNFTTIPRLACACVLLALCPMFILLPGLLNPRNQGSGTWDAIAAVIASEGRASKSDSNAARQPRGKNPAAAYAALQELEDGNPYDAIAFALVALSQIDNGGVEPNESPGPFNIPAALDNVTWLMERGEMQQAIELLRYLLREVYAV